LDASQQPVQSCGPHGKASSAGEASSSSSTTIVLLDKDPRDAHAANSTALKARTISNSHVFFMGRSFARQVNAYDMAAAPSTKRQSRIE
jgi:hypothetical protein